MKRPDSLALLAAIQARLRQTCHAFVNHDAVSKQWTAGIHTERNAWPFSVIFMASTPARAVEQLQRFMDDEIEDARAKRSPRVFLATIESGAPAVPGAATTLEKTS